jgi:hypothetical protein
VVTKLRQNKKFVGKSILIGGSVFVALMIAEVGLTLILTPTIPSSAPRFDQMPKVGGPEKDLPTSK